jgi:kumamolisin
MSSHVPLQGSYSDHPSGSVPAGRPAPGEIIQLTLILRRKSEAPEPDASGNHLSHDALAQLHGADPADIQAVKDFVHAHHWSVVSINQAARSVTISGWLGDLAGIFSADLELRQVGEKIIRTRQGYLHVPAALDGRVIAVLGFDQRPVAATYHAFRPCASQSVSYTPPQVAQLYNFPEGTGANQTIALIELGGGFDDSDLQTYCSSWA